MGRNTWENLIFDDPRGMSADGLTLASFTTSAPVFPTLVLPANYFKTGRKIEVKAYGIWAATATPTYTFRLQSTVGTVVTLVTSAAITVSAVTNQLWIFSVNVQCRTEGTTGTLMAMGSVDLASVTGKQYLPAAGTAPATATVDTTIAQTWGLEIACSASSASNTVKGIDLEIVAKN